MFDEVNKRFDSILEIFRRNRFKTDLIEKAYKFADEKHNGTLRLDKKPYISHPVEVARILAKLGFDEDVVSAALLHDVVEDCNVTLDDITKMFNENVANMVDCVSAIDKAKYVLDHDSIYEDLNFEKASIEEQSFKKLISIGKQNPKGFCVKFADRLHNLSTIECFDYSKQLEKVKETEKWIIPIAKKLNANYFYRKIKNECFKIVHRFDADYFLEQYVTYHKSNEKNLQDILSLLSNILIGKDVVAIKYDEIDEYAIYDKLKNISKNMKLSSISQGSILKVPNYNIYVIYKEAKFSDILNNVLNLIGKKMGHRISVINIAENEVSSKTSLILEDEFKNKYNLYVMKEDEYYETKVGVLTSVGDIIDDDELDELDLDLIKIKTRSGEIKYIKKGSTVLDFAFKIHRDIGLGFKDAIINKSKSKIPPYTKLLENDQVEILVDLNPDGTIKNQAKLKWFAYINTDLAKKYLIKYFEKLL